MDKRFDNLKDHVNPSDDPLDKSRILLIVVMVLVIAIELVLHGMIHYFCGTCDKKNKAKDSADQESNNFHCANMTPSSPQFNGYTNTHDPATDQISTNEKAIYTISNKVQDCRHDQSQPQRLEISSNYRMDRLP